MNLRMGGFAGVRRGSPPYESSPTAPYKTPQKYQQQSQKPQLRHNIKLSIQLPFTVGHVAKETHFPGPTVDWRHIFPPAIPQVDRTRIPRCEIPIGNWNPKISIDTYEWKCAFMSRRVAPWLNLSEAPRFVTPGKKRRAMINMKYYLLLSHKYRITDVLPGSKNRLFTNTVN